MIIQVFRSDNIHPFIYNNIMRTLEENPDYSYYLITDEEGENLIKTHFEERIYNAYKKLDLGAAKADFIRYIALFLYGGIYLDLDASIECDLKTFIPSEKEFVFLYDSDNNILQWMFMTMPKNPILLFVISEMVSRIEKGEPNIFIATGPTLFTDILFNYINHTEIYDTSLSAYEPYRKETFEKFREIDGGLILNELDYPRFFLHRMDGYTEDMLYDENHVKYIETYNSPTPSLYKQPEDAAK
jgi:mannosyltransferase OCH1-like enzyme